jgi:hypothetical protein
VFTTLAVGGTMEMVLNSNALTALLVCLGLVGMGALIGFPLRDNAAANHRRATEAARHNDILSGKSEIPAVRGEIAEVRETTGRHAARIDGEIARIDDELNRIDADVASVAEAVHEVADKTGVSRPEQTMVIAGSYWKRQEGIDAPPGTEWATDNDSTTTYRHAAADHTTQTRTFPVPPFVPEDPSQVWGHMLHCIKRETGRELWPWTINASVPTAPDGTPFTLYDTYRGKFLRDYGVELPADMHELWPSLIESEEWRQHGPRTSIH